MKRKRDTIFNSLRNPFSVPKSWRLSNLFTPPPESVYIAHRKRPFIGILILTFCPINLIAQIILFCYSVICSCLYLSLIFSCGIYNLIGSLFALLVSLSPYPIWHKLEQYFIISVWIIICKIFGVFVITLYYYENGAAEGPNIGIFEMVLVFLLFVPELSIFILPFYLFSDTEHKEKLLQDSYNTQELASLCIKHQLDI